MPTDTAAEPDSTGNQTTTPTGAMTQSFPWGPVTRLVITLLLLAGALALLVAGQTWTLALIALLGLRLLTDLLLATSRERPATRHAAHLLSAATWAYLPLAVTWIVTHSPPFPPAIWLLGLSLLTGGLALLAHHERENARTPGSGRMLGTLGLVLAPLGAGLATTGPLAGSDLQVVLPLAVALASLILLAVLRPRIRREESEAAAPDARDWLGKHRLRLLLLLLPVVAYLLTRPLLAEQDLWFPLWAWEFVAAVAFVSYLLWAVRAQLRPLLSDDPLQSPHHRHEPSITRYSEAGFDEWESAVGEFLRRGDKSGVNRLAQELERDDRVPATQAFSQMLSLRTRSHILLVHPAWLYLSNLLALLSVILVAHHYAQRLQALFELPVEGDLGTLAATVTLSTGLYLTQANRHGGPWWLKTLAGYTGLLLFLLIAWSPLQETLRQSGLHIPDLPVVAALIVLAALPLLHAARAHSHTPRYAYDGHDPAAALEQTVRATTRTLIGRTVWIGGIGAAVFAATLALTRVHPSYELMLGVYGLLTVPLLIVPGVTLLGLRLGRRRIERITRRETTHRKEHLEAALVRLEEAYEQDQARTRTLTHRPPRGVP